MRSLERSQSVDLDKVRSDVKRGVRAVSEENQSCVRKDLEQFQKGVRAVLERIQRNFRKELEQCQKQLELCQKGFRPVLERSYEVLQRSQIENIKRCERKNKRCVIADLQRYQRRVRCQRKEIETRQGGGEAWRELVGLYFTFGIDGKL